MKEVVGMDSLGPLVPGPFLIITRENNFPNKKILITFWKTNFLNLRKNFKVVHFSRVLNTIPLILMLGKLNRVFNKLIRVLVYAKSYLKNFIDLFLLLELQNLFHKDLKNHNLIY